MQREKKSTDFCKQGKKKKNRVKDLEFCFAFFEWRKEVVDKEESREVKRMDRDVVEHWMGDTWTVKMRRWRLGAWQARGWFGDI